MGKTVTNYVVNVDRLDNTEDRYRVYIKAGSGVIDCTMERDSLRHIIEIIDTNIGTGIKSYGKQEQA